MLILGHRGAPREAPENTIASFAEALRQGADGVELDVQRSADGVPIVIHDATLDRTTGASGRVDGRRAADLAGVTSRGEPLPTLEGAAAWAAEHGARLNVEVKAPGVEEATLEVLAGAGVLETTILSSFDPRIVATLGSLSPSCTRYLLSERWDEGTLAAVASCGAGGICLRVDAASRLALQVLREEGLPVVVWTVNEPGRLRELMRQGVQGIITDHPARAAEIAGDLGLRG